MTLRREKKKVSIVFGANLKFAFVCDTTGKHTIVSEPSASRVERLALYTHTYSFVLPGHGSSSHLANKFWKAGRPEASDWILSRYSTEAIGTTTWIVATCNVVKRTVKSC